MNTGFMGYEDVKNRIIAYLQANLNKERLLHTLGVEEAAVWLAEKYGLNIEKASIAGLLHDCAKCLSKEELYDIIKTKLPNIDGAELLNYKTYHAPVGELFCREKFNIFDKEILDAVRYHTLGRVDMTVFEKIIFLADKIEAKTRDKNYREKILQILNSNEGEKGLDMALLVCFSETVKSLVEREMAICPVTVDVYNWLLCRVKNFTK